MLCDITWWIQLTQLFYNIIGSFAFLSIIGTIATYFVYRKQLNIATMSRCIDIYRRDFLSMKQDGNEDTLFRYIDFINEEFFYMENGFIPGDAAKEWISGMIDHVPIYSNNQNMNPLKNSLVIETKQMLAEYPRVRKVFTQSKKYDFDLAFSSDPKLLLARRAERERLIEGILSNLGM